MSYQDLIAVLDAIGRYNSYKPTDRTEEELEREVHVALQAVKAHKVTIGTISEHTAADAEAKIKALYTAGHVHRALSAANFYYTIESSAQELLATGTPVQKAVPCVVPLAIKRGSRGYDTFHL